MRAGDEGRLQPHAFGGAQIASRALVGDLGGSDLELGPTLAPALLGNGDLFLQCPRYRGIDAVLASPEGLKKFVSIKESPYHSLNFCQGTVSEQLEKPGEQIYDVIRYLGSRKKIFSVHFRNIEGGYLNFRESFIDNGSVDMLKAARVYKEVGYDGVLMPDHVPHVEGDVNQTQGFAFAIGYIKAERIEGDALDTGSSELGFPPLVKPASRTENRGML